jgi:hypothetical protein
VSGGQTPPFAALQAQHARGGGGGIGVQGFRV